MGPVARLTRRLFVRPHPRGPAPRQRTTARLAARTPGRIGAAALAVAIAGGAAAAQAPLPDRLDLNDSVAYRVDPTGSLAARDIVGTDPRQAFRPAGGDHAVNFGYSDATVWLRIELPPAGDRPPARYLEVGYFSLDEVTLHVPGRPPVATGLRRPPDSRPIAHRHFVFPIELAPRAPTTAYLEVRSTGSLTLPLTLWEPTAFLAHSQRSYAGLALYYGALAALALYNLLLFVSLRDPDYLLYVAFVLATGVGMLSLNGLGSELFWADWTAWNRVSSNVSFALAGLLGLLFARRFLGTAAHFPRLDRALLGLAALFLLIALAPLFGASARIGAVALSTAGPVASGLVLVTAVRAIRRGIPGAPVFALAWSVLLAGAAVGGLRNLGWLPTTPVTAHALQVGSALEMLLLSFALADRIRAARRRRKAAQNEALAAREELLQVTRASERRLEGLVAERTAELRAALAREQDALAQYEQFGALISHEFRNPLAIIGNQAELGTLELEQGAGNGHARFAAITRAAARLRVLFEHWLEGGQLLHAELKAQEEPLQLDCWLPQVAREALDPEHPLALQGEAGTVLADPELLRIAVYNLLDNARKYSPAGTTVTVATLHRDDAVGIRVSDAGPGIPEDVHDQIFFRHFRENGAAGNGLGLGLYMVQRVAELHGGRVDLRSQPGAGSAFTLWLHRSPLAEDDRRTLVSAGETR